MTTARRARARPSDAETGSVTIQLTVLIPVLFLIAFTGMQAALFFYGRSAASAAALAGARAGATEDGTTTSCHNAAQAFLTDLGDVLSHTTVTCQRTPTTITVVVEGDTLSVIPAWTPRVTQQAHASVERVT
jgi:Flp pilus assembly protein TadG